jgi:GTP-binding protein
MLRIKQATFIKSIVQLKDRPTPFLTEFAFAGRSNVGKSSLINSLVNRHNFARISKSPGKTRTINYFLINESFYLVDLPGYGFARVSEDEKKKWHYMIEDYIIKNEFLRRLFVLIDSKVGLQKNDYQLFEWLHQLSIPYTVILTKIDKIQRHILKNRMKEIEHISSGIQENDILHFSARKRVGKEDILRIMEQFLKSSKGVLPNTNFKST